VTFATPEQSSDVRNIEKLMRTALPVANHPELSIEVMRPQPKADTSHWRQRGMSSYGARHRRRR
jgi:hypothetical protein